VPRRRQQQKKLLLHEAKLQKPRHLTEEMAVRIGKHRMERRPETHGTGIEHGMAGVTETWTESAEIDLAVALTGWPYLPPQLLMD